MLPFISGMLIKSSKSSSIYGQCLNSCQVSRRCSWRFCLSLCSKKSDLLQLSGRAFEGVRTPFSVRSFSHSSCSDKLSGRPSYTVWALGQTTPSSTRIRISKDTNWEGSTRRPDDVATRPDITQCFRIFWVSFTDAERSDSVDRPDAWSSRLDMVLSWEELRYSEKAVAEDRPNEAKWPSRRS
jgi:hypothetical protein